MWLSGHLGPGLGIQLPEHILLGLQVRLFGLLGGLRNLKLCCENLLLCIGCPPLGLPLLILDSFMVLVRLRTSREEACRWLQ